MTSNKISAYLVVYNEESKIEACLQSLVGNVDEIVVVHDGECSDQTLEIAKKYTDKIFVREKVGNAEPHRPFAIKQCSGEWVFQIDADERLSTELQKELRNLVADQEVDAYSFNWVANINDIKSYWLTKRVLFRKNKMYALGIPHIQAETRGKEKYIDLDLLHDTTEYNSPTELLKKYIEKDRKWGMVTASILSRQLSDVPIFNCLFPNNETSQSNKLMLMREHSLVALVVLPLYGFFYGYFKKGGYKHGYLGFVLSCHTPLHAFFTCYYLLKKKFV